MGEITDGTLVVYLGADGGINTGLRHAGAGAWDGWGAFATALLASLIPAWRAARVPPADTLSGL